METMRYSENFYENIVKFILPSMTVIYQFTCRRLEVVPQDCGIKSLETVIIDKRRYRNTRSDLHLSILDHNDLEKRRFLRSQTILAIPEAQQYQRFTLQTVRSKSLGDSDCSDHILERSQQLLMARLRPSYTMLAELGPLYVSVVRSVVSYLKN